MCGDRVVTLVLDVAYLSPNGTIISILYMDFDRAGYLTLVAYT